MSKKVFLSFTASDCVVIRQELSQILLNAGLQVMPEGRAEFDETHGAKDLMDCDCSVHILGGAVGKKTSVGIPESIYQIQEAIEQIKANPNFKVFIWNVAPGMNWMIDPEQQQIVNNIRNNITDNVVFTNIPSPVQLVDDIRTTLQNIAVEEISADRFPLLFMCNFIDEDEAHDVTDMLSDIMDVKSLVIGGEQNVDYGSVSTSFLKCSDLGVVFFSEAGSWAIPFVHQLWKLSGGASSRTPLLFIGDEDVEENEALKFDAPNVLNKSTSLDLIPLEIKVTYDKIKGNAG